MKIVLSSYHNPNFVNTNVYRKKAITELGHTLISVDDRPYCLPGRIRKKFNFLQKWDLERINKNFIKIAKKEHPDLWFVVGGDTVLATAVSGIKSLGIPVILWTTNVPDDFEIIKEAAPLYDHIFCAGSEAVDILEKGGIKNTRLIPFGCDPDYHKPVELSEEDKEKYQRDVVFVGSFYPNRAAMLEGLAHFNIGIWGPYWSKVDESSALKEKIVDVKLNYEQWVKIYSAAKITVVVHYQDETIPSNQASPKLFEAMACGSFVLVDEQKDVQTLFEDSKHVVFYKDKEDLRNKAAYYLKHDRQREQIARNGYNEVRAHHTFKDRIARIIEISGRN